MDNIKLYKFEKSIYMKKDTHCKNEKGQIRAGYVVMSSTPPAAGAAGAAGAATSLEPARTQTKGIVDMLLAQQMMSILQGRGAVTISWQQISEIIVVMSLDEVKTALISAISTIKQMIVNNSGTIWQKCVDAAGSVVGAIKWITYGWLVSIWAKRRRPQLTELQSAPRPIYTAQVSCPNTSAFAQIIKKMHKMDVKSHTPFEGYDVDPEIVWDVQNLEETIITEKWSNVRFIVSDKVTATINGIVETKWKLRKNGKILEETNIMKLSKVWYILPKTRYKEFRTYRSAISNMLHWSECARGEIFKLGAKMGAHAHFSFAGIDTRSYHFLENVFAEVGTTQAFDELGILLVLDTLILDNGQLIDYVRPNIGPVRWGALFGVNYSDDSVQNITKGVSGIEISRITSSVLRSYYNEFIKIDKDVLDELAGKIIHARRGDHVSRIRGEGFEELTPSAQKLTVNLQSSILTSSEILDEYYAYYHELIEHSSKPTGTQQKQKIYTVMCNRNKKITQVENPAFKQWHANVSILKDALGSGPNPEPATKDTAVSSKSTPVSQELIKLIGKPPPATINEETCETTIESKEMNEIYKPFNTLYVCAEDHRRIKSSLQMFKDRQELLYDLGLPNKYGLLLTGPPGTGKTSTIYAVATELQKPIWYVQLSKHYTCGELRQVFEHVYKIKGGGIIVFEDIDSMTDIVLARSSSSSGDTKETAAASIMDLSSSEDTPLTLSYFLNFLDGALTQNGSIVIATTNHPERLDPAFKRPGRFDLTVELGNAKHDQICAIYNRMMGRDPAAEVLARIPEDAHSTAAIIFRVKDYMLDSSVSDEVVLEPFLGLEPAALETVDSPPVTLV